MTTAITLIDHPLVRVALTRLRDKTTPMPSFRQHLRQIGFFLGYEALRDLAATAVAVETPLARTDGWRLAEPLPALITILRAGNGLLGGLMDLLPEAPIGHLGLYRDKVTLKPVSYYEKLPPDMAQRLAIVCDPMLATGQTAVAAVARLKALGVARVRFLCLLASPEGLAGLQSAHPDLPIWTAAIDERLNDKGYILPGLGDAGDRLFGTID